jgi:HEAT repeat protein
VLPALLRTLAEERSDDLLAAAAIAVGRIGAASQGQAKHALAAALEQALSGHGPAVSEAAALALGILGDDASAPLLADLMLASRDGKDALAETRVPIRVRAYAAYALGLLGSSTSNEDVRRYAVHQLVWCLETDRSESVDLAAACVNALGVIPVHDQGLRAGGPEEAAPPGSSLAAQIDYLLALLGEERRDSRVRAQVPIALGRLLAAAEGPSVPLLRGRVAEVLFDVIAAHRREPREVVQSCVIALGQIGDADGDELDQRIRRMLLRIEDLVNDVPTRQYAVIALGRACGRAGQGRADPLREERAYLLHELGRGGTLMRPWAALAVGISERGAAQDTGARKTLAFALDETRADDEVGAYSLGLGLSRASEAAPLMIEKLGEQGEQTTRGHVALGLGLGGSALGEPPLLALLPEARFQPALLHDAGLALELLGDDRVVGALVDVLRSSRSVSSQGAVGLALARSKDARAVDPLLALLGDASAGSLARAYAAASLGALGDRKPLPWRALYSVDVNLHAAPETLFAPEGGGLLNLF